jgi:membrane associated rhomboid family serine protease
MKIVKIEQIFKDLSEEENYKHFKKEVDNYNFNDILRKFLIYGMILIYCIQIYLTYIGSSNINYFYFNKENINLISIFLSNFSHGPIFHLILNLFAFSFIIKRLFFIDYKTILFLIFIGSMSSLFFSYLFMKNGNLLGSSGFIFALFGFWGCYLFDGLKTYSEHIESHKLSNIKRFLTINAFIIFALSFIPNVAWYAHLGGFLAGYLFYKYYKNKIEYKPSNYKIISETI